MPSPQSKDSPVLWHVREGVGHIVMNRPDAANAIDLPTAHAFAQAVDAMAVADIGAVLLSARGKQFCAGGDIRAFVAEINRLPAFINEVLDPLLPALARLGDLPLPVISAVHGPVGGAGIALALCADIALASDTMKLRGGYSAIGLSPDLGASYFLARRSSGAQAKRILMTNVVLSAPECLALGLVDGVHPAAELPAVAQALAQDLAQGATGSLGGIKRLCDAAPRATLAEHLDAERRALLRCARSADGREGITAFIEKRAPRFNDPRID